MTSLQPAQDGAWVLCSQGLRAASPGVVGTKEKLQKAVESPQVGSMGHSENSKLITQLALS